MDQDIVRRALDKSLQEGCEYAEARWQKTSEMLCLLRSGKAEPVVLADAEGIGVRVLYDGALGFGATNILDRESVGELVKHVIGIARKASQTMKEKVRFSSEKANVAKWGVEEKVKSEDVTVEFVLSFLKEIDNRLRNPIEDVSFPNRNLVVWKESDEKYYANSEGASIQSSVPRFQFNGFMVAMHQGKPAAVSIPPGYSGLGGAGGWEVLQQWNLPEYVPKIAKEMTSGIKASAKPPVGETLDVILGPNVAGLTCHESCGHPGEADRILGREGAQAGESFLKADKLGLEIGSKDAFVSDDPTIPGSMGYYLYDDEGVKARKRKLIYAGKFTEFLQNRSTASFFHVGSNGSSRAVQYDREPIIRMANTFIEPGDWSFDEMIKDVRNGVYIRSFMEWNIDDKRLNQRYVGLEAFKIENGELREPVKEPVFEITTPKYWGSIDARAKDLEFTTGTCGKGDPMQGAPVFFGAPHVRLRGVRVGAR